MALESIVRVVNSMLNPVRNQIANLVSRAIVTRADDSKKVQTLQIEALEGETRDVERFQNYGFTSVPISDSESVVVFLNGRRDHGIAIAVDDRRYRLKGLESGEVAMYTDQGDKIVIKRGGLIEVTSAGSVSVTAPTITLAGAVTVTGAITAAAIAATAITVGGIPFASHVHAVTTAPGTTGIPT